MHINIQCLKNKCNILEAIINSHSFNVVMISEHWLKDDEKGFYQLNNYKLVSSFSRSMHIHGGVGIFARNDVICSKIDYTSHLNSEKHFENSCTKITNSNCIVLTLYRSPRGDLNIFIDRLYEALQILCETYKYSRLIVGGDFNINFQGDSKTAREISDIFYSFGLEKCISEPTRVHGNSQTCIDNIFVNFEISEATVRDFHLSDHKSQIIKFTVDSKNASSLYKTISNKSMENKIKFTNYLACEDWSELYSEPNPDKAVDIFYNVTSYYHSLSFPQITVKINANNNFNRVFTNPEVIARKAELLRLNSAIELMPNSRTIKADLKQKKYEYEQCIIKLKKDQINMEIQESNNKQKTIWNFINRSIKKSNKNEANSISPENYNTYFTQIAEKLIKQIPKSHSTHMEHLHNSNKTSNFAVFLYPVLETEVQNVIQSLKNSKATDLYDQSVDMYKENLQHLSRPLTYIINLMFEKGIFPNKLKKAKIIPLFKAGDIEDVSCYRPIALLPILAKIFEKIIALRIINYLETHKILSDKQFGFRKGKNTSQAIWELVNFISEGFESFKSTLVLFLDLSKAFDCVSKEILLNKLDFYGFKGVVYGLMSSYLSDRYQCVYYKEELSNMLAVKHGVPQGSVLGPLLFLIYVNDLPDVHSALTVLFADDTTFAEHLRDAGSNGADLQANILSKSSDWFNANKLCLNTNKTHTLLFSTKTTNPQTVKFLGLTLDTRLSWHPHINDLSTKLSKKVYGIRQIKNRVNLDAALIAYHALFHSAMVYGLINWGTSNQIQSIFIIQKKAIRALAGLSHLESCKSWFTKFNILTLPSEVIYCNLNYIKEHLSEYAKNGLNHEYNTRNRDDLQTPYQRLESTKRNNFGIALFNSLPINLKSAPNKHFKTKLKKHLLANAYYNVADFRYV